MGTGKANQSANRHSNHSFCIIRSSSLHVFANLTFRNKGNENPVSRVWLFASASVRGRKVRRIFAPLPLRMGLYLICTSIRVIYRFCRFSRIVESTTCVVSIPLRGSIPTAPTKPSDFTNPSLHLTLRNGRSYASYCGYCWLDCFTLRSGVEFAEYFPHRS
jgi:hypothetical protein